jgi:hypothetical protein
MDLAMASTSCFSAEICVGVFVKGMGSTLAVGSACRKNTNAKVERANGTIGDTLRAYANARKDDWYLRRPLTVFAVNRAALCCGDTLAPFLIDPHRRGRSPAHAAIGAAIQRQRRVDSPAHYVMLTQMRKLVLTVRHRARAFGGGAAGALGEAGRGPGRLGVKVGDRVLLQTKELLDAADTGKLRPRQRWGRGGMDP